MTLFNKHRVLLINQISKKMNLPFQIAELIRNYIMMTITEQESEELDRWLAESDEHQKMFDEFCHPDYIRKQTISHAEFDREKGFLRFLNGRKKIDSQRILRKWLSVAAVLICLFSVGISFLFRPPEDSATPELGGIDIHPGYNRALLVLADGKKVDLESSSFLKINEYATEITIQDNQLRYQSQDSATNTAFNKLLIPRGGEFRLVLSDGTQVWLNAETELQYPVTFQGEKREVILTGEAYFEVAKDTVHPFIVKTGNINIRVLGTSFNIKAYQDEEQQMTLLEGKVRVSAGGQEKTVWPNEQLTLRNGNFEVRKVETAGFIAWKEQRFVFIDEPLEGVLRKLERWYDISFFIQNTSVRKFRFTGNLPKYENLNEILKKLELTTRIRFVQNGRAVTVLSEQ